jgi:hypothetical protein
MALTIETTCARRIKWVPASGSPKGLTWPPIRPFTDSAAPETLEMSRLLAEVPDFYGGYDNAPLSKLTLDAGSRTVHDNNKDI